MQQIRSQLSETQGALTEKVLQVRQLRVDYATALNSLNAEKHNNAAKLQQLEAKINRLTRENEAVSGGAKRDGSKSPLSVMMSEVADSPTAQAGGGDDDEKILISRSRIREVEAKYKTVTAELADKTKLCHALQQQVLAHQRNSLSRPTVTDLDVVQLWEKLRNQIRTLSLDRFNEVIQLKKVTDKSRIEFEHLSTHWKTYMTTEQLTCYMFRALIWRYLHTALLDKYCRVWGKEYGDAAAKLAGLFAPRLDDARFQDWRIRTAAVFHEVLQFDLTVQTDLMSKIFDAVAPYASGKDTDALRKSIADIVAVAAQVAALFARGRYQALMSDKPGSALARGFSFSEATMDMRGKLGSSVVDMMLSPCLLKKEADYSVLLKAEVIC
ncbi:hypothetical protein F4677DRAFT_50340 [Hypoxylon crocopeplum]|nr:hypothetical protein F4677DRAFT_50340 [Hypoxylon crocopeplum]